MLKNPIAENLKQEYIYPAAPIVGDAQIPYISNQQHYSDTFAVAHNHLRDTAMLQAADTGLYSLYELTCLRPSWLSKILIAPPPEGWGLPGYCWLWQGALSPDGYPKGRPPGEGRKDWLIHRWVCYNCITKEIAGLEVDHLCFNRNCIQPAHLQPCTHEQNLEYKHQRLYGCDYKVELSSEDIAALADGSWLR